MLWADWVRFVGNMELPARVFSSLDYWVGSGQAADHCRGSPSQARIESRSLDGATEGSRAWGRGPGVLEEAVGRTGGFAQG